MEKETANSKKSILVHPGILYNYFFIPAAFIYGLVLEPVILEQTTFFFGKNNIWFLLIFNFVFIIEAILITIKLLDAPHLLKPVYEEESREIKKKYKSGFFVVILWLGHFGLHGLYFIFYTHNDLPRFAFYVIVVLIFLKEFYLLSLFLYINSHPVKRKRKISLKRRVFINLALGIICLVIITMTTSTFSKLFSHKSMEKIDLAGLLLLSFLAGLMFYLPARFGFFMEEFYTVREKSEKIHLWISILLAIFSSGIAFFVF